MSTGTVEWKGLTVSRSRALAIGVVALLALGVTVFAFTRDDEGSPSGQSANPIASRSGTAEPSTSASTLTESPTAESPTAESTTTEPTTTGSTAGGETTSPGGAPTSAQTTSPDDANIPAPATPVDDDRADDSLCAVTSAEIDQLADLSGADEAALESLRDAIPLLDARLSELVAAAEGRPELEEPVQLLDEVLQLWRTALAATDAGDDDAAQAALQESRSTLEQVERSVTEASSAASLSCD